MTKLSKRKVDPEKFGHYVNNLWAAFTLLTTKEGIRLLFKDLFTHTEYKMFAKRLEIARRLLKSAIYAEIQQDLKVTSGTITRVSEVLETKGAGLRKVCEKLEAVEDEYYARQREKTKNMENRFRSKARTKTLLGQALKAGAGKLDKIISAKLKERTARHTLPV